LVPVNVGTAVGSSHDLKVIMPRDHKNLKKELLWAIKHIMAIKKTFISQLVSKKGDWKLYCNIIRPVIANVGETWVLNQSVKLRY
jgi:hypothetical protein